MTGQLKRFLIANEGSGGVRLTVRETRYNSQGYPWVSSRLVEQVFATPLAARSYAVAEYGATAREFASQ